MTYEQLIELGDKVGTVSKGLTNEKIQEIPTIIWKQGTTK